MKKTAVTLVLLITGMLCCVQAEGLELAFSSVQADSSGRVMVYIVGGEDMDIFETTIYYALATDALSIDSGNASIERVFLSEKNISLSELAGLRGAVVLVGSPEANNITRAAYDLGIINMTGTCMSEMVEVGRGSYENISLVSLSHIRPIEPALSRRAKYASPLRARIPLGYIPIIASALGFLLLSLSEIAVMATGHIFADDEAREPGRLEKAGLEALGFILGVLVLAASLSWTFSGTLALFSDAAKAAFIAGFVHHLLRKLTGLPLGVNIRLRLLKSGSLCVLLSSFFGSPGGICTATEDDTDENCSLWRYAVPKVAGVFSSFTLALVFFSEYLKTPTAFLQLASVSSSLWAMGQMIPVAGLDGHDIKQWSRIVWVCLATPVTLIFLIMNFI